MSHEGIRFEVDQVWVYRDYLEDTYVVASYEKYGDGFIVYTMNYHNGILTRKGHFMANADLTPKALDLGLDRWHLVKNVKIRTFTRISPKTLRKRMREQMAAKALTHRLTE